MPVSPRPRSPLNSPRNSLNPMLSLKNKTVFFTVICGFIELLGVQRARGCSRSFWMFKELLDVRRAPGCSGSFWMFKELLDVQGLLYLAVRIHVTDSVQMFRLLPVTR